MTRILIVDDHPIVRRGLQEIVADMPSTVVVDEAADGQEALSKVSASDYDVVVLDISMPGMSGLQVLRQLRIIKPGLPVLMLSIHPEEQYAVQALKDGASGYVTKGTDPDELISAIQKVLSGGKYVSRSLGEKLARDLETDSGKPLHDALSPREYQVMRMIAAGKTATEIAEALSISVKTISTYRFRILSKMKMKSNAQLMRYAIENGLVDSDKKESNFTMQ